MRQIPHPDSYPAALAVSVIEAARALGISRSTTYELIVAGELPSPTIGRRRLVRMADVEAFLERRSADAAR